MNEASLPLRAVALMFSAIVAPYVTTFIVSIPSAGGRAVDVGWILLLLPFSLFGVLFGFIGALLFLAPAFAFTRRLTPSEWAFPLAGVAAAIAHTVSGWALITWLGDAMPGPVILLGGYLLIGLAVDGAFPGLPLVLTAACIGGLASGWTYGQILALGRSWLDDG